jgi:hypothetical protein
VLGSTKYPYKLGNLVIRASAENYWRFLKWLKAEGEKDPQLLENIRALARSKNANSQTEIVIASEPGKSPGIQIAKRETRRGELQLKHTIHFDPRDLSQSKDFLTHGVALKNGAPQALTALKHAGPPRSSKAPPNIPYPMPRRFSQPPPLKPQPPQQAVHSR